MKGFIFGFHRLTRWPKWTPASTSSSSRMGWAVVVAPDTPNSPPVPAPGSGDHWRQFEHSPLQTEARGGDEGRPEERRAHQRGRGTGEGAGTMPAPQAVPRRVKGEGV